MQDSFKGFFLLIKDQHQNMVACIGDQVVGKIRRICCESQATLFQLVTLRLLGSYAAIIDEN